MSTVREILDRVRLRLPQGSENFWSDADLLKAYNEGLDELSEGTEFFETHIGLRRRKFATYHDLRGVLPETALRITGVFDPSAMRWVHPISVRDLDLWMGRGWEDHGTAPLYWFVRGLFWLGIYPRPGDDDSPVTIYFTATHPHAVAEGESNGLESSPGIPPDHETTVEEYMLSDLFSQARESEKAMAHWQSYTAGEALLRDQVRQRITPDHVPRMGARR
jgi:hypothetical protein